MTDFNEIFKPQTEAERQAAAHYDERRESSKALYNSLNNGDYISAGKILQEAGACQWDKLLRDSATTSLSLKPYETHYLMDKDKTSVEIIEKIWSRREGVPTVYVPRLTVTDDSCKETENK
ncbi:MAG: hypothetical protein QG574_3021 [Cyanobacteriota bacterium erpe_2018_sw_21hr_WHONDRS-SW48-000092_B_bin.40]|jgi:hypothetical protein|nr:hypothetical protein [Cyanobacteriota bacterium erpe_2018_sw_21hr_WHONDRS-SW48-000092_B_bin.40]